MLFEKLLSGSTNQNKERLSIILRVISLLAFFHSIIKVKMIAGDHGRIKNPNSCWTESRGFYLFYFIFVTVFHLILLSLPFITTSMAWTITNLAHNISHFYFLHIIKGTPWISTDEGKHIRETHWEQIDDGAQWSRQRKILFSIPIILFLLTSLYTKNNEMHFITNFISLIFVLLPKLPSFHHRRLFDINKY